MASTPASAGSSGAASAATAGVALNSIITSPNSVKRVDDSLWWESFITLLEELDSAPPVSDIDDDLVNKLKRNHAWLLESVSRFKPTNEASRRALDFKEISLGVHSFIIKPELKEAALRASKFLCLDEVQTYILFSRSVEHDKSIAHIEGQDFLQWVLLQYFFERQCLLKCIRHIFVNSLNVCSVSHSNGAIKEEALQLIRDGLEKKMFSVLEDLLSFKTFEKFDVELVALWVDETIIEDILILDILFLAYYDNFCVCNAVQWMSLCSLFKDMIGGDFIIESLAVSVEARASFARAKVQLLLILIEALDLENLLHMVHDDVPFSEGGFMFSLQDVQKMDSLVSTFSGFGTLVSGPLLLSWAVFICLLSSLPDIRNHNILIEIDHVDYARQAFEVGTFNYVLEVLRSDCLRDSDGLISGFLTILRTFMSGFIASYELTRQPAEGILSLILEILCEIYKGEESLSIQFWDKDSFVDGPIRSLLYMLESEYPYHIIDLLRLLSALCNGSWSAECVYNFLEKMNGLTLLFECPTGSPLMNAYGIVEAHRRIPVPGVEGLFIPPRTRGQVLKIISANIALVRWECAHSGVYLLLLRLAQVPQSNGHDEINLILDLLYRLLSSNAALCFNLLHLDESLHTKAARKNGLVEQNVCIDVVRVISFLTARFIEDGGHPSTTALCLNILVEMLKCSPSHVIGMVLSSNIFGAANAISPSGTWLLSGGLSRMLLAGHKEENGCYLLTTSVLDLIIQLVEKSTGDAFVCALVVFSLQYIFVNHIHMKYKMKYGHWKVTMKALDVMKSCVKELRGSPKLGLLVRNILYSDSSIHNSLCRLLYVLQEALEKSSLSRYGLKETEELQDAACSALNVVHHLLADLLKETFSGPPPFVQILLPSSSKSASVFSAALSMMNLFSNPAVQVAATKVLSMMCVLASRFQPYSIENITLADAAQIGDLTATICRILDEEPCKRKDLLISILDFLFYAAYFQPSLVVPIISSHVEERGSRVIAEDVKNNPAEEPLVRQESSGRRSVIDSILKYVKKFELLFNSDPRLLLSIFNFFKSLWDSGAPFIDALEKVRKNAGFWEHLSSVLAIRLNFDHPIKNLDDDDDIWRASSRFRCQGIALDIIARELFLQEKVYQNEKYEEAQASSNKAKGHDEIIFSVDASQSSAKLLENGILSNWDEGAAIDSLVKSYSSGGYDLQTVACAKMAACVLMVHLMLELSNGRAECLSVSLIERIRLIHDKLRQDPSFSSLLEQYSFRGYSDGKEVSSLVLHDLYYHLQGELEGRSISSGHFQELSIFLHNYEIFQCKEGANEKDLYGIDVVMYDIPNIRDELGINLWDKSEWKTSKEVAEKMLSSMHSANLMLSLSENKNFALKALISVISLHQGKVLKSKSTISTQGISDPFIERNIIHICKCIQSTGDSLIPVLNHPPAKLLESLTTLAEMLLVLSRILFSHHSHKHNKQQLFSFSILLVRTSGSCFKLLATGSQSAMLNKALKFLLMVLLMSMQFNKPFESINDDYELDNNQLAEAPLAMVSLLPVLCKFVEHTECFFDLSVASMDLMMKSFLTPDIWLPILRENLSLKHLMLVLHRISSLSSVTVTLNFLLTLARTKGGAEMLYSVGIFSSLKIFFSHMAVEKLNFDGGVFSANFDSNDKHAHLLGLALAITSSLFHFMNDDSSVIDIFDGTVNSFFSDKTNMISSCLSTPNYSSDVQNTKSRNQDPRTSLTALRLSEHALSFICLLARHRDYRKKGMKEIDFELRCKSIHFLAFISKEVHHVEDLPCSTMPLICLPTQREESEFNEKSSFIGSKHGWFAVFALGILSKHKATNLLNTGLPLVSKNSVNGYSEAQPTYFTDVVAIQTYRIAYFLLTFLCMQAKAATERAVEIDYIDLARFPDLPMPEILHGLQDQAIAIVVDVCESKGSAIPVETEDVCLLMLQILEKSLYLEFCVTQSCGIRPVLGRIEDFSREFNSLIQVVNQHKNLKAAVASLSQIITHVYPGLLQTSSLL